MAMTLAGQSGLLLKRPSEPGWEASPVSVHGVTVDHWPLNPGKASHPLCTCGTAIKMSVAAIDPQPQLSRPILVSHPTMRGFRGCHSFLEYCVCWGSSCLPFLCS